MDHMPASRLWIPGSRFARPGMTEPMQWTDEGIVLGVKRHGETSVILELMTREHGRHLGLVRGGAGTRLRGVLQPGNALRRDLAGAARRASRPLFGRSAEFARGKLFVGRARRPRRDASCGAVPASCRARAACGDLHRARRDSGSPRRSSHRRADDRALRAEFPGGTGLWPRSFVLRRNRGDRRSHLRVAAVGPRRVARRRRSLSRQADAVAGLPASEGEPETARDLADAFALTGFFLDRHAFAPRGLAVPEARARFVAALTSLVQAPQQG